MNKALVLRAASLLALAALPGCTLSSGKGEGVDATTGSRITVTDGVYHAPEGQTPPPWAHNPPLDTPKPSSASSAPSHSGHGTPAHDDASRPGARGARPPPPPDASIDVRTAPRGAVSAATLQPAAPGARGAGAGGPVLRGGISAVDPAASAQAAHAASLPAVIDTGKSPAMR